ncbi:hypothetical protein ACFSX5_07875 [Devosia albogilva]|uniref:Mitochondrial inner membrane protein n=1 Tax=Devosia albogilva TaxID=429726 RepID=A0ABW5QJB2_9HYPH
MADTPGDTPKPTDPKAPKPGDTPAAAARSSAVKPPVLDLKAKDSKDGKPEAEAKPAADKKPADKPKPASTAPKSTAEPERSSGSGSAVLAAIGGGVIGLAAAYGLAWAGLWPTQPVPPPPEDPRLGQFSASLGELETVASTTQSELAALNQRLAALETAEPSPVAAAEPVDVAGLEADIAALAGRIDSLSQQPAPSADPEALASLEEQLGALGGRLDEVAARLGTAEAELRTLDTAVAEANQTLSAQPEDIAAVLQLPLIVSGLETAFTMGRPYESELSALRAAMPELSIPAPVADAAATGLARPDTIETELRNAVPAMLAGRPGDPDANWQDGALDWFSSAIALRPIGEVEGDSPEAVLSRLEAAVARRDFIAADELMGELPDSMRAAAGELPRRIAAQAEAARLLSTVRAGATTNTDAAS